MLLAQVKMMNVLLAGAAFLLVLSLWMVFLLLWSIRRGQGSRLLQQRLGLGDESDSVRELRLWHDGHEATTHVPGRPHPSPMARVRGLLAQAGWKTNVQSVALALAGMALLAGVMLYATTRSVAASLLGPAVVLGGFWIYLTQCIARQEVRFEKQLMDAMDLAARSLRAGHPLMGAFGIIAEEVSPPVGHVFAKICQQQAVGVGMEEALRQAAEGSASPDLKLFATSVSIQLRAGGNLSDMMDRVATVIRNRMWLARRLRVLTAQTQFSKRLLLVLPFIVFVALNLLNPAYMRPLYTTPMGQMMLMIAGAGLAVGAWVMNRLAVLKY